MTSARLPNACSVRVLGVLRGRNSNARFQRKNYIRLARQGTFVFATTGGKPRHSGSASTPDANLPEVPVFRGSGAQCALKMSGGFQPASSLSDLKPCFGSEALWGGGVCAIEARFLSSPSIGAAMLPILATPRSHFFLRWRLSGHFSTRHRPFAVGSQAMQPFAVVGRADQRPFQFHFR